jgi:GH25 family lysozyme M1 (1,4-beta-N-acetylmuramidase)
VIRLRRRRGIAGTILILVAGLALAAATQTLRGPAAQATTSTSPVQGTDVSSIQGSSINWADVAGSERFISIKATEGNYYADSDYQPDVTGAAAAGLYVMPYVFANPYGSNSAKVNAGNGWGSVQADYAWKTIGAATPAYKSSPLMLPVAVDLEADPYVSKETNSNQCYGLAPSAMVTWIQSFITEMKKDSGKTPVIYTSPSWWSACTGNSGAFKTVPLWLASWGVSVPSIPSVWPNLTFWQYSDSGQVSGIGGAIDLDSLGPTQATAVNTAIPAEQIQTLSSLAAQNLPSGYSATGLPTGLSISATGVITGKPSAIGQYSVTVTPPAGAAPASMSFPWDVHGTVTVSNPASRSSAQGAAVSLAITASGPDQTVGFAPSFSATGLPPGLSISSPSGLITGSPTSPGTFKVTVTAADALGGSGTASFTWTVTPEATCPEIVWQGGVAKIQSEPCSSGSGRG